MFCVYSVSKLLHELRNASLGISSAVILHPNFLAEHELINDALEFIEGISCEFHEKVDSMLHCSLSYVQRWNFLIMKQCCGFLQIDMIPGKHFALISHLVDEATGMYLSSRFRRWNPNSLCHDTLSSSCLSGEPILLKKKFEEITMAQNEPKTQLRAEGDVHLQK
jgi:hypothetical protein